MVCSAMLNHPLARPRTGWPLISPTPIHKHGGGACCAARVLHWPHEPRLVIRLLDHTRLTQPIRSSLPPIRASSQPMQVSPLSPGPVPSRCHRAGNLHTRGGHRVNVGPVPAQALLALAFPAHLGSPPSLCCCGIVTTCKVHHSAQHPHIPPHHHAPGLRHPYRRQSPGRLGPALPIRASNSHVRAFPGVMAQAISA